jgi:phenylalanyl-tRNA synthetase beta chain
MNVSVNWLRELVPALTEGVEELAHRFSMSAAAVESIEPVGEGLEDIVVARVLESGPHPNADRLKLCRVDAGGDPIDVVCGAPVVEQGALYPYVPAGATLPGGFKIESRKIRGEMSHGMLCSEIELGLGRDKSGIMRLPDGLEPGHSLTEVLGLPDLRLSLDLNPNRVDLASHVGVARELATGGVSEVILRETGGPSWSPRWQDGEDEASGAGVTVRIESPDRCSRYLGAVIRGVTVGPSPAWLAGRLLAIGARPINNVVDATNYVLFELNQPIHAFDLKTLSGSEIRVRAATDGEMLHTLDGESRTLSSSVTAIADRDRAVALAGVMGGEDTEVTAGTSDLFIECAAFDPASVRDTGRAVSLATDASYRFERGIDERGLEAALTRCVELILSTAGGEADPDGIRAGVLPPDLPVVVLRRSRVKQVLGIDPSPEELARLLVPIGFDLEGDQTVANESGSADSGAKLRFRVPGWRSDVTREIDLVEEVARRFGFENFPHEDRRFRPSSVPDDPAWEQADRVRRFFVARGLLESRSLSFMPAEYRGSRSEVAVPNPLSAEESSLRGGLVPVLLRRVEHNFARARRDLRLYEIGTVFSYAAGRRSGDAAGDPSGEESAREPDGTERFHEELRVGAVISGAREPQHWSSDSGDLALWDLKGLAAEVAEQLCGATLEPVPAGQEDDRVTALGGGWLGEARFRLVREGLTLGIAGPVRATAVDAPPWAAPLWAIEFDLGSVQRRGSPPYRPLSTFPGVRRDLAVTVPIGSDASALEKAIAESASPLLESVRLFDVYSGEGIHAEHRSLAWAFRFRAEDRTLTDQEVDAEMKAITLALEEQFDARIRTS